MNLDQISIKFTKATLNEIVQKAGGTKCTSYEFGKGFKKGDSYLSKVFRLRVHGVKESDGSTLQVNLVVKAMPDNLARRKLFRSRDFFRNEINFYTSIVPALEAFQQRCKPQNPFTEYPRCYASLCDGEHDFIALEDVSFLGYCTPNRQSYITLEQCKLVMRTLGRFHGITLAFRALEPQQFAVTGKCLEETYYAEQYRSWYMDFLKLACEVARNAVSKTYANSKYETIATKYLQAAPLYDDMIKLVSSETKLTVFCHGDCWSPNFLTRYAERGTPEALKIIDFQLARCASLALDISFFIYSCTSQELREQHYELLLREYHQSASALISDLGANAEKVLSWDDLIAEMRTSARFGCGMGIESLPMSLIEDEEVADLDEIADNFVLTDVWNIKPFQEAAKCERIAQIFKHAIDQGYIK